MLNEDRASCVRGGCGGVVCGWRGWGCVGVGGGGIFWSAGQPMTGQVRPRKQ